MVTSTADDVNDANCTVASCTLRQAVNAANANNPGTGTNTITFSDTFSSAQTITLLAGSGGHLTVIGNVTIDATVGNRAVTISGGGAVQLFVVNSGVTLGLRGLTLANGSTGYGGNGGAIVNNGTVNITASTFSGNYAPRNVSNGGAITNGGTVNVTNSTFTGNSASNGGAINNGGTLNVTNSTFTGNNANSLGGGHGGAINNINNNNGGGGGTVNITGSTFTGNTASNDGNNSGYGGAIYNDTTSNRGGSLTLTLSILAGNSADVGPDLYKVVNTDGGGNVIGNTSGSFFSAGPTDRANVNALLGTLGSYGGPVQTVPLLPGSPAINIAACPMSLTSDARGVSRPQPAGGNCDAGAFESQGFTAGTFTGDGQSAKVGTAFGSAVGLTVSSANSEPVAGGQVTFTITPATMGGASATFGTLAGCTLSATNTVAVCTIPAGGVVTSPTFTANGIAGNFTIVATANSVSPTSTTFHETVTPQTYIVTRTADDVNDANCTVASCTLRQAVKASNAYGTGAGTNTITFDATTFSSAQTITLSSAAGFGTLTPTHNVTIDATVGNRAVTISGGGAVQLFVVSSSSVTLGLHGLTLTNGNAGASGTGGAIYNNGTVNVTGSTFTGNQASLRGGAIVNNGMLQVTNSTFTGNMATTRGGAIGSSGTTTITGSTFTGNNGGTQGGAINKGSGTLTLALSVVADNTVSGTTGPDIDGTVTSGGGNVIGNTANTSGFVASDRTDVLIPGLGTLGNYGGTVQTIPLLPGSPAIDILACPMSLTSDARGVSRPQGTKLRRGCALRARASRRARSPATARARRSTRSLAAPWASPWAAPTASRWRAGR